MWAGWSGTKIKAGSRAVANEVSLFLLSSQVAGNPTTPKSKKAVLQPLFKWQLLWLAVSPTTGRLAVAFSYFTLCLCLSVLVSLSVIMLFVPGCTCEDYRLGCKQYEWPL